MTRPLPIAAGLALALLSATVFAQTPPAPEPATPANDSAGPVVDGSAPAPAAVAAAPAIVTTPAPIGDAARGARLTYTCQGCHGIPGYKNAYPNFHVPRIGGQAPQYLSSALHEYRKGARKHPTMQAQAESFSEQDIADISAFLSGLKP